ncbi:MAG TPA: 6-pyruvoyl-tetrahydropterin synthase-related protein [Blastocatellia bacterium]|nr:6-pyruvoyl-tetrahydropterin synthase-related protein [Blastocatellia bacterium]
MDNDRPSDNSTQISRRRRLGLGSGCLLLVWMLSAWLLTARRLTHPAFGIQGDLPLHYHFMRAFARSLAEGEWWPRWAGLLDGGRGDALFTFYPPLSYLIGAGLVRSWGLEVLTSIQLLTWGSLFLAQLSAYLLAREFFGRRRSLLVSLAYVLLPAYPMIALNRGFLANALALGLAPLTLLGAHLLLTGDRVRRGRIIFALGFSAVILTHTITTLLCGLAVGLMAATSLTRSRTAWRGLRQLAGAGVLVSALTGFFLWPQLIEQSWVQLDLQIAQHSYRSYFLFAAAPDQSQYRLFWADLNQITSLITLAQTLTAACLGIVCGRALKSKPPPPEHVTLVRFSLGLAILGFFISLPLSDPVWRYLPGFKFIQFPWRLQPLVGLACGLLAAASVDRWRLLNRHVRNLIAAVLTWLLIANGVFTTKLLAFTELGFTRAQVIKLLDPSGPAPSDHRETGSPLTEEESKQIGETANQIFYRPPGSDRQLYPAVDAPGGLTFISGQGRIVSQTLRNSYREFNLENEEPARVRIETYHYPHWVARLDGREVPIGVMRESGPQAGLMTLELPAGSHRLTLSFEIRERSERWARAISLAAWLLFIAWIARQIASRVKRDPPTDHTSQ